MMKSSEFKEFKDLIKQNRAIETKRENNQRCNGGSDTVKEENESNLDDSDEDNKENVFMEEDKKQHHKVWKFLIKKTLNITLLLKFLTIFKTKIGLSLIYYRIRFQERSKLDRRVENAEMMKVLNPLMNRMSGMTIPKALIAVEKIQMYPPIMMMMRNLRGPN